MYTEPLYQLMLLRVEEYHEHARRQHLVNQVRAARREARRTQRAARTSRFRRRTTEQTAPSAA